MEERQVYIKILSDKDKYGPSDNATITVQVVDKDNKPVANANVLVSIVDEAMFALYWNSDNILSSLYAYAYSHNYIKYVSYIPNEFLLSGYAEMGGGDDHYTNTRWDFKDTAYFDNVITDKHGNATIKFKLPDNITSWRVTALAITNDNQAGSNKLNLITTRDLFINPIVNTEYILGDDVAITLKASGDKANKGDQIDYEVTVLDSNQESIYKVTVNSTIGNVEVVNLRKLSLGNYSVKIVAKNQTYSDAMILDFEVIESGLNTILYKEFNLKKPIQLEAKRYPVNLTFYNSEYKQYHAIMNSFLSTRLIRNDEKVAYMFMKDMLNKSSKDSLLSSDYPYRNITRGDVGELDASPNNIEFTARLCAAYPEYFNQNGTIQYLYNALRYQTDSSRMATQSEVAAAYMGLAALKQPVLYDIKYLLETEDVQLNELSKLYLIAGLALIGDYQSASEYYNKEIKPNLQLDTKKGVAFYLAKGNFDDMYMTAIASITTSVLNTDDSEMVIQQVIDNGNKEYLFLCEKMVYIRYFLPITKAESTFEYTLDGKTYKETIDKTDFVTISVSKEQYDTLNLRLKSGNVDVIGRYIGPITELEDKDNDIKVVKTVTELSKSEKLITIKVTLPEVTEKPMIIVEDYIPSGGRYTGTNYDNSRDRAYLARQEKQHLRYIYSSNDPVQTFTIQYKVRTIIPGEYTLDSAVATMGRSVLWGKSDKGTVRFSE